MKNDNEKDILDWILEIDANFENDLSLDEPEQYLQDATSYSDYFRELVIKKHEKKRLVQQTKYFSHDDIKVYISKHLRKLFGFQLIGIEQTLITGRIDILAKDRFDNVIGIEIKKKALNTEYNQFKKYYEELKELYGVKGNLIVLSSSFQKKLLDLNCSEFNLWRYEIWWNRSKDKKGKNKYILKEIRVCPYERNNNFTELFKNEKINYLRSWKK